MKVGVFHPGTQHSWQTALAFQESSSLAWYATSVYFDEKRWPYRALPILPAGVRQQVKRELSRRRHSAIDSAKVREFGIWEWLEIAARRARATRLASSLNRVGNTAFGRGVIKLAAAANVDVLWGYDGSSLEVFRWGKKNGVRCILDQTIGHPAIQNDVLGRERELHPEFFFPDYAPFDERWLARQDEELELADVVVVGSVFCANTLLQKGCDPSKIRLVPHGYDELLFSPLRPNFRRNSAPIECLFVGQITARKGVAYLLNAFANLDPSAVRLKMVGTIEIPAPTFARYAKYVTHVSHVPRHEVVKYFESADCFLFPSLFEGGAIVLYEAAAAGLAIIQSDRSGDGVRSADEGVILEEISVDRIVEAVTSLVGDKQRLVKMQDATWRNREERSWRVYRKNIRQLIES